MSGFLGEYPLDEYRRSDRDDLEKMVQYLGIILAAVVESTGGDLALLRSEVQPMEGTLSIHDRPGGGLNLRLHGPTSAHLAYSRRPPQLLLDFQTRSLDSSLRELVEAMLDHHVSIEQTVVQV